METPFPNRRWLIIPSDIVESINFDEVIDNSAQNLRYSIDRTKTFVKYDISEITETYTNTIVLAETNEESTVTTYAGIYGRPSFYSETYPEYTHQEILEVLSTEEWTKPIEEIV